MTFLFAYWRTIAALSLLAVITGYVLHCEHVKKTLSIAHAQAREQIAENAKQALRDKKAKEQTDEDYKRRISRLSADVERLRKLPGLLPAIPTTTARPELACFDRGLLGEALQRFRAGVEGLVGEGAEAVEGLDQAREWAQR